MDIEKPASYRYDDELPADSALLGELLKATEIQQLFESYYNLIKIPVAIIDLNANVLLSSRWQRICTRFHRVHPTTCSRCIESDTQLATQLQEGKTYSIYACRNGLTDCASPIIIEGKHIANVFIGQFLIKEPDEARFRRQAEEFGFDIADYLAALHEVPIVEMEKIPFIQELLIRMTRLITNLSIDRKRAIESQTRHSIILNTIPQSVFWKDLNGQYLDCNAPFARTAGLATPDDIVGKTDFDLPWPRHDAEAYRTDDRAVIAANQPRLHSIEPLHNADGSRIIVDISKIPLVDANNAPYGLVGIFEDITERRQAEEKLKKAAEEWRTTFNSTTDLFLLIDKDYRITKANKAAATFLQLPLNEIIGHFCYELMHATTYPLPECPLSKLQGSMKHEDAELYLNEKNIWVQVTVDPVLDEKGELLEVVHVVRDITERKKLEAQLHQAQKMESMGRLAGGVAHDYNNMLSVILGYSQMALEKAGPETPLGEDLQEILSAAKRTAGITRQLLTFARKQTILPQVLDLNETITGMINMLRRLIGEDIDLTWLPASDLWPVKIDPSQMDQLLANLCINARDAITGVGKISIETESVTFESEYFNSHTEVIPGDYVLLTVGDNGCGMEKDVLDNIFEPFFTTKEIGKGTGLGLSTVYGIVQQHNGFVHVYSEPGKGTTYKIYLPRHPGEIDDSASERDGDVQVGQGETILVVEDEEAILKLTSIMLRDLGYTVLTANTPNQAVKIACEWTDGINLLLTDVIMPEMNGRDLAVQLLAIHPDIKCLFMSGYSANIIADQCALHNGIHLIQKPYSAKDLATMVRKALNEGR